MSAYYNDTSARLPVNLPNAGGALPGFDEMTSSSRCGARSTGRASTPSRRSRCRTRSAVSRSSSPSTSSSPPRPAGTAPGPTRSARWRAIRWCLRSPSPRSCTTRWPRPSRVAAGAAARVAPVADPRDRRSTWRSTPGTPRRSPSCLTPGGRRSGQAGGGDIYGRRDRAGGRRGGARRRATRPSPTPGPTGRRRRRRVPAGRSRLARGRQFWDDSTVQGMARPEPFHPQRRVRRHTLRRTLRGGRGGERRHGGGDRRARA